MKHYQPLYQPDHPTNERPTILRLRSNRNRTFHLNVEDIYYIRADKLKCYIICKDKVYYVQHPMIQLYELVPEYFTRLHRSIILNPNRILFSNNDYIEFEDHTTLDMSMNKGQWLAAYMAEMKERQIDFDMEPKDEKTV